MGAERAGQRAHVWADEITVHVLIGGQLVKTVPSSLTPRTWPRCGCAARARPGRRPRTRRRPGPVPCPAARSSRWTGTSTATATPTSAGHRIKSAAGLAGRRVTLRLDGHLIHVMHDGALARTLPMPRPPPSPAASSAAPASPPPRCQPPRTRPRQRAAQGAGSRRDHGHPAKTARRRRPTPGRSSPSTSRTPTSASPAKAPKYHSTPAKNNGPSPGGKPKSTHPGPDNVQHHLRPSAMS